MRALIVAALLIVIEASLAAAIVLQAFHLPQFPDPLAVALLASSICPLCCLAQRVTRTAGGNWQNLYLPKSEKQPGRNVSGLAIGVADSVLTAV